jgi:uncharacterized protein YggE
MKHARLLIAACTLAVSLHSAFAQETLSPPHIRVTGDAVLSVPPDAARMRAGVTTTGKTAKEAGEANAQAMASVIAAIKAEGIADKDVQTSRYGIQPVFDDGGQRRRITGFVATNNVTLTARKLESLGTTIDKLTAAGANAMGGVEFIVSDASKLLDKVRADALADARRRAQIYADAAGGKLGGVLTLSENVNTPGPMVMMARAASPAQETPIAAGESTLQVSVNVVFELVK